MQRQPVLECAVFGAVVVWCGCLTHPRLSNCNSGSLQRQERPPAGSESGIQLIACRIVHTDLSIQPRSGQRLFVCTAVVRNG